MGLLVGVAVFLVYVSARAGGWDQFSSTDLWLAAAVLFISTSAGKLLGLHIAKRELRRAVREIRANWARQMARLPSVDSGPA